MNRSLPRVRASWLGSGPYRRAWDLQAELVRELREGAGQDTLLLLEHPHVFTMGKAASGDHLLWGEAERERREVEVVWSDRGGEATYHGPGQLVGYPVLDLAHLGLSIPRYLELLEKSLIDYLGSLGIESEPGEPGFTGVWRDGEKLAAIGIKLNRSVVSHGFALNLTTDLEAGRDRDQAQPLGGQPRLRPEPDDRPRLLRGHRPMRACRQASDLGRSGHGTPYRHPDGRNRLCCAVRERFRGTSGLGPGRNRPDGGNARTDLAEYRALPNRYS